MHRTRLLALAAVVTLAIAPLAACSGGDDSAASSTTATDGEQIDQNDGTTQGDSTEATTIPTSTVPDDEFEQVVGEVEGQIAAAGTDPCDLFALISTSNLPTPNGAAQSEQAGRLIVSLLNSLAASTKPGNEANAKLLQDTATKIVDSGEASGWSLESLQAQVASPEVQQAWVSYGEGCTNLPSNEPPVSQP
ncbi:MAG: hypothetical protein ACOYML_06785 [Microthrixaceae bacterium]